jgi:hypothetical protein
MAFLFLKGNLNFKKLNTDVLPGSTKIYLYWIRLAEKRVHQKPEPQTSNFKP